MSLFGEIDFTSLSPSDIIQIEMASRGCISGTLKEWPVLRRALKILGLPNHPDTPAMEVTSLCILLMRQLEPTT